MEFSQLPLVILLISYIHPGEGQERPKPQVVKDQDKVRCEIAGAEDDWTFSWFIEGSSQPFSTDREFSIKTDVSNSVKITCRGWRNRDGLQSEISDSVTVNLPVHTEPAKPLLTVHPESSHLFRGETVTLTCDIKGEGWRYRWMCGDGQQISEERELRITVNTTRICSCLACRESFCSQWSDAVTLIESVRPKVTVTPQSSVFTGDSVTLSCDVGQRTGQRIIWYKDYEKIKSGDDETQTLRDVRVSDGGKYCCGVEDENNSTTQGLALRITVKERPRAVVRAAPAGLVWRGQTVNLTCDIQDSDVSSWTYSWSRDDSVIHGSDSQDYRISSVDESHTGQYSCSGRETRGSRHTHTSAGHTLALTAPEAPGLSGLKLLSFLLAVSSFLLPSVILGVKYYRAHAQSEISQNAVRDE